ncbi:hypothetical protein LINPERPRIM_LOCUS2283 [Linum perenne]
MFKSFPPLPLPNT